MMTVTSFNNPAHGTARKTRATTRASGAAPRFVHGVDAPCRRELGRLAKEDGEGVGTGR